MALKPRRTAPPYRPFPDPAGPPYATFRDSPTLFFVEAFREHVGQTARPETFPGVYKGRLPADAKYRIVTRFHLDGRKREDGSLAPCPMCSPNRFLSGVLAWFYELQVCAAIGHCCAHHAHIADREFRQAEDLRHDEDYLLAQLPLIQTKLATVRALRGTADETTRAFRKLRSDAKELVQRLRTVKERGNAQLVLFEVLSGARADDGLRSGYVGPAGFRGRGSDEQTRDVAFGPLRGTTALLTEYNPSRELRNVERQLELYPCGGTDEEVLNLIAGMTEPERRASVANLHNADRSFGDFKRRLLDFWQFFDAEHVDRLSRYGGSPLNHQPFEVALQTVRGLRQLLVRDGRREAHIVLKPVLDGLSWGWAEVPYKRRR